MFREREEMLAHARPHKELVEDFISSLDLSDNTVVSYGGMLRRYVNYLEQNRIEKPKESDLVKYKKYIKWIRNRRKEKEGSGQASDTEEI